MLVINDNYRLAPWADVLYACDFKWWRQYNGVPEFTGQKWTVDANAARTYPDLHHVKGLPLPGLSSDQNIINTGRNSGYQAINLAILFGAARIVLLGYDMQVTGDKRHWFGEHPAPLVSCSNYGRYIENYRTMTPDLERLGIPVINCTRETALTMFPRMELSYALAD